MRSTVLRISLLLCLLIAFTQGLSAAAPPFRAPSSPARELESHADGGDHKIAPELTRALQAAKPDDKIPVIVTMKQQADLGTIVSADRDERVRQVVQILQETAGTSQMPIHAYLQTQRAQGQAGRVTSFWVFNGLAVPAKAIVVDKLAARPDVASVSLDSTFQAPAPAVSTAPTESNISAINAPALWDLGYLGQNVVVANVDTGVYLNHDDLSAQWRGGSNSWFDPYNEHPDTPADLSGHGTQTMGVMVGRDAGGTSIGVAPGAQWIAVRIFDDQGQASSSGIHAAYQWLLDPDGDPGTADAPHVVNSSWSFGSPGCNLEFQLDLQALRAANILPIFSAGNFGPYSATDASPANNPEAFAVGAVDDFDQLYVNSSRGPSSCGEAETVFPELVAPGVGIRTSTRYNLYADATGTSVAAPHAAGVLALLLSAYPQLTAAEQADALLASAVDLGPAGPDNDFGFGRLDALAAYQYLLAGGPPPTPTPVVTPTSTPTIDPNVNLALNRPATVSSFKDDAHMGDKAVDGDALTLWQTAKAVGKNVLPAEWIIVDLGSSLSINEVSLKWGDNFATNYSIQVSEDNSTWTTVFDTATGDGGDDIIVFTTVAARYVQLDSTAWSSSSQRNWLQEFEIYSRDGAPPPTATPTPTPTPAPTATPAPSTTVHVGDLDGSPSSARNRWNATVSVLVHDAVDAPVAGATVSGNWSGGVTGDGSCVTDANGWCDISKSRIKDSVLNVTFSVSDVALSSTVYQPVDNHDPDMESDGTTITVAQP